MTSSWNRTLVVLKTIPSVEEFAYIAAHVLMENKLTARVVIHVARNVQDHLVEDHKFLAQLQSVLKFVLRKISLVLYIPIDFTTKDRAMSALSNNQGESETKTVYYNQSIRAGNTVLLVTAS